MQIEQKNRNSGEIENPVTAILDKGAKFEGRLTFEGTVQIGGDFYGEIFTKDTLVIVNGANVHAQIEAETIIISGKVEGNLFARQKVIMNPPAVFRGTVTAPSLKIEEGVVLRERLICLSHRLYK